MLEIRIRKISSDPQFLQKIVFRKLKVMDYRRFTHVTPDTKFDKSENENYLLIFKIKTIFKGALGVIKNRTTGSQTICSGLATSTAIFLNLSGVWCLGKII